LKKREIPAIGAHANLLLQGQGFWIAPMYPRLEVSIGNLARMRYPAWFCVSTYPEIARTIFIGPFRDEVSGKRKIHYYFTKNFGDVIEVLDIEANDGGYLAVLRFKETCITGVHSRTGSSLAYDFTAETLKRDLIDDETYVRPAVFNGVLWVGELPRRKVWTAHFPLLRSYNDRLLMISNIRTALDLASKAW
jgi:hypothetical protein